VDKSLQKLLATPRVEKSTTHHAHHDQAPGYHYESEPDGRVNDLHHHVRGNLCGNIEREENCKSNVVVKTAHSQINLKVDKSCIPDVGTVQEAKPVEY
jgi:hypothetical protein